LQFKPPQPSLHWQDSPFSRKRRFDPSASESHSAPPSAPPGTCACRGGIDVRGIRQSWPPQPGGHWHWPSYLLQSPYCPHVNAGRRQLKHGGHLSLGAAWVDLSAHSDAHGRAKPAPNDGATASDWQKSGMPHANKTRGRLPRAGSWTRPALVTSSWLRSRPALAQETQQRAPLLRLPSGKAWWINREQMRSRTRGKKGTRRTTTCGARRGPGTSGGCARSREST
jgi:hypothetical protein